MNLTNEAMIIWCLINLPFTFLFNYYGDVRVGSAIFLVGFAILCIIGLFQAHKEDKIRNAKNEK